jgi:uncharacterized protein YaiE (UPF0345 family)
MPQNAPEKFENVTVVAKANVYFDGKVVSHTVLLASGKKKTLGIGDCRARETRYNQAKSGIAQERGT